MESITYYVRVKQNVNPLLDWLCRHSRYFKDSIANQFNIWVVYDIIDKRTLYPGGVKRQNAEEHRDILEYYRKNVAPYLYV